MTLRIQQRRKKLALSGELNIYTVGEAAQTLLPKLDKASPALDLSEVSEIDGAGLQLLLKARRVATRSGHDLDLLAASPAVLAALDLVRCEELRGRLRSAG